MNENEQIEEIIKVLCADYGNCEGCPFAVRFVDYYTCEKTEQANRIVLEKGYRKVERGEWMHKGLDCFRKYQVTCPFCQAEYVGNYDAYDEPEDFNFCPNCGADMRGER